MKIGSLVGLLGLAAVASGQKEIERVEPAPAAPAGKVLEWTTPEGQPYLYLIPKAYSSTKPASLLIMCHGTGGNHHWSFANYPIADRMFRPDDIVVSPDGLTPGGNNTFNFVQNKKDSDQIAGLINHFKKKFAIARVYLYGHSQGAFFTYYFAGERPELIDGIVAHAGNVLDVKFPPLAKTKVGIGILHGRADAVVPVECAFRTEKVYKDQGFEKVRLKVVEGLNEQTGHWPLPVQVAEMLGWLDEVSVASPAEAAASLAALLKSPEIGLPVLAASIARTEGLLKKAKDKEAPAIKERIALARELLESIAAAHVDALSQSEARQSGLPFGSWVAHFLAVNESLSAVPAWTAALKNARAMSEKHAKAVDKATKDSLKSNDARTFSAAVKSYEEDFLAPGITELEVILGRAVKSPPKGAAKPDIAKATSLLEARTKPSEEGRASALKTTAAGIAKFREKHPELAPAPPTPSPEGERR